MKKEFGSAVVLVWASFVLAFVTMQDDLEDVCTQTHLEMYCRCNFLGNGVTDANCYVARELKPDSNFWMVFGSSKNLNSLQLSFREEDLLKYFPQSAIGHTNSLKNFILNFANINTIPSMAFRNSTSLLEIDLSNNKIVILEPFAFAFLSSLETLTLSNNNLTIIKRNMLTGCSSLKGLFLSKNKIEIIEDGAFSDLKSLEELFLTNNFLKDLRSNTFKGLNKLIRLEMINCGLRVLKNQVFSGLPNIQGLDLRENQIESIDPTAFNGASNLMRLYLSKNKLVELDDNTFKSQQKLTYLDLRWNNLESLTEETLSSIKSFHSSNMSFNNYVLVSGNHFVCDCRIKWMLKMVKFYSVKNNYSHREWDNITCTPPQPPVNQIESEFQESTQATQGNEEDAIKEDFNVQAIEGHSGNDMKAMFLSDAANYLEQCPEVKHLEPINVHQTIDSRSSSYQHNVSGKCNILSFNIKIITNLLILWQFLQILNEFHTNFGV